MSGLIFLALECTLTVLRSLYTKEIEYHQKRTGHQQLILD